MYSSNSLVHFNAFFHAFWVRTDRHSNYYFDFAIKIALEKLWGWDLLPPLG